MIINKIHIENYKSLKNVDFELNDGLNIFIGKNDTGKTNLFDALRTLSALILSNTDNRSTITNLGGLTLFWEHDPHLNIKFEIDFKLQDEDFHSLCPSHHGDDKNLMLILSKFKEKFVKVKYRLQFDSLNINTETVHLVNRAGEETLVIDRNVSITSPLSKAKVLYDFENFIINDIQTVKDIELFTDRSSFLSLLQDHNWNEFVVRLAKLICNTMKLIQSIYPIRECQDVVRVHNILD